MKTKEVWPKLPKAFKKKLIKALRSGKYQKSVEYLYRNDEDHKGYCCLGVACSIQGTPNSVIEGKELIENELIEIVEGIPDILTGSTMGHGANSTLLGKLTEMNDGIRSRPRSFKQIANWIEKNL